MNIDIIKLKMVKESTVAYDARTSLQNPESVYKLLTSEVLDLVNSVEEQFYMIALDTKGKPIGIHLVSQGSLNATIVHPRKIFKRALLNNANAIIVAHNHPSGNPTPSEEDISITKRLSDAGEILGIKVVDHIIIGNGTFTSLQTKGLM